MPQIVCLPTSDHSVLGSWIAVGGATAWSVLDDLPSDGDTTRVYSDSASVISSPYLHFTTPTIPAGATIRNVALRANIKVSASLAGVTGGILTRDTTHLMQSDTAIDITWTDYAWAEWDFEQHPEDARAWLASDFDDNSDHDAHAFFLIFSGSSGTNITISTFYMVIDYTLPLTWDDVYDDPARKAHWLLAITAGPVTHKFAETDLVIDGLLHQGCMTIASPPRISIDPYSAQASSCTARVTLVPRPAEPGNPVTSYPFDLSAIYSQTFLSMVVELSIWVEGTAYSERKKRLVGYVDDSPSLDSAGNLTLSLADFTQMYFNRSLPLERITENRFPVASERDWGSGAPILYGQFNGAACINLVKNTTIAALGAPFDTGAWTVLLVCQGANLYSIIGPAIRRQPGDLELAPGNYVTEYTYAAPAGGTGWHGPYTLTSPKIGPYTLIVIPYDAGNPDVLIEVNGKGEKDDDPAYYTSVAGAWMVHPTMQLAAMLVRHVGIPKANMDVDAFKAIATALSGWTGELTITGADQTDFTTVARDACQVMRCGIYADGDQVTAKALEFDATSELLLVEDRNLLSVDNVSFGRKDELATSVSIKYNYRYYYDSTDPENPKFASKFFNEVSESYTDNATLEANVALINGYSDLELETKLFGNTTTAGYVLDRIIELHGQPRAEVKCKADRTSHVLNLYSTVTLTFRRYPSSGGVGAVAKKFVVTAITFGTDANELELLEC